MAYFGVVIYFIVLLKTIICIPHEEATTFKLCQSRKLPTTGILTELMGTTQLQCGRECVANRECQSANWIRNDTGYICQLLQETSTCDDLQIEPTSDFLSLAYPRCMNGGTWNSTTSQCDFCLGLTYGQFCEQYVKDCEDANSMFPNLPDIYIPTMIKPDSSQPPFLVNCRMLYGGILYWSKRNIESGTLNFTRGWHEYKNGFGDLQTFENEYLLGLEKLHLITRQGDYKLMLWLIFSSSEGGVDFEDFSIGSEAYSYHLHYTSHSSHPPPYNADGGFGWDGAPFCTYDRDCGSNCPTVSKSGWWFPANTTECSLGNLHASGDGIGFVQWPVDGKLKNVTSYDVQLHKLP